MQKTFHSTVEKSKRFCKVFADVEHQLHHQPFIIFEDHGHENMKIKTRKLKKKCFKKNGNYSSNKEVVKLKVFQGLRN